MTNIPTLGGNAYQLNVDVSQRANLDKVYEAGKGDGLDQIYVHDAKTNTSYVIQGDGLNLSDDMKNGRVASANLPLNGKNVEVSIMAVDNEVNTAKEGFSSVISKAGMIGGIGVAGTAFGTAAAAGLVKSTNIWVSLDYIAMQGVAQKVVVGALAVGAAVVGGSALFGALRPSDEDSLKQFITQSVGVRTN